MRSGCTPVNGVWAYSLWWKKRKDSADGDQILKVFGFVFFAGVVLALTAEGVLMFVGAFVFLSPEQRHTATVLQGVKANLTGTYYTEHGLHQCVSPLHAASHECQLPCGALKNITAASAGTELGLGSLQHMHKTVGDGFRVFLMCLFLGYIDAAMVEEAAKLIGARAKACWFWADCCVPVCGASCRPCCLPGWRAADGAAAAAAAPAAARGGTVGPLDPWGYIIYMVAAAAGFSTAENMEYLFLTPAAANHNARPDCYAAPGTVATLMNVAGR
eukprot:SAG22_NODE_1455_length_4387_cov_108.989972_5_plen_273_part_00